MKAASVVLAAVLATAAGAQDGEPGEYWTRGEAVRTAIKCSDLAVGVVEQEDQQHLRDYALPLARSLATDISTDTDKRLTNPAMRGPSFPWFWESLVDAPSVEYSVGFMFATAGAEAVGELYEASGSQHGPPAERAANELLARNGCLALVETLR